MCGTQRLQTLKAAGATLSPLPASGDLYVFGGGTARAVGTYDWTVKCGARSRKGRLDAVKGSLCLLLGREFGKDFGLSDDMGSGEIKQNGRVVPTRDVEGLKHIRVNCTRGAKSSSVQGSSQSEKRSQEQPYEEADRQLAEQLQAEEDAVEANARAEERTKARESMSAREEQEELEGEWKKPKRPWKVKDNGPMFRGLKSIQVQASSRVAKLCEEEKKADEGDESGEKPEAEPPRRDEGRVRVRGSEERSEGSEVEKSPERKLGPSARAKPKFFEFTDKKLQKMHRKGHGGVERLMELFRGALTRKERKVWKVELEGLEKRIQTIYDDCKGCNLAERPQKPGTSLRPVEKKAFARVVGDLLSLDARKNYHAMGIVDEATSEVALQVVEDKTPQSAAEGSYNRWFSLRGSPEVFISDMGREFLAEFTECLEDLGVEVSKTAPRTPEAHGKIERVFESVRRSLDRVQASGKGPKTRREWQVVLSTIENSIRNELRAGGYSSAQRGTGRGCLLERNLMTDTPVTGYAQEDVGRLLELAREATEAYRYVVHNRKIRQAMNEKIGPELKEFKQGEKVYYFRDEGRGIRWRGPGVVTGYNPDMKVYTVSAGGRTIHVGWRHMKSAEERVEEAEVEKVEVSKKEEVLPSTPQNQNAAKGATTTTISTSQKERSSIPLQQRNGTTKPELGSPIGAGPSCGANEHGTGRHGVEAGQGGVRRHGALREAEDEAKPGAPQNPETRDGAPGPQSSLDEYRLEQGEREQRAGGAVQEQGVRKNTCEFFKDIFTPPGTPEIPRKEPEEKVVKTRTRGRKVRTLLSLLGEVAMLPVEVQEKISKLESTDHYAFEWSDVSETEQIAARLRSIDDFDKHDAWSRTCEGTKAELLERYPGAEFLRGRVVDKAKIYNGVLQGRSRWTPKGFMQREVTKSQTESPTVLENSTQMVELIGLSSKWDKSLFDFSEAFFNSKPFGENETPIFVEVPFYEMQNILDLESTQGNTPKYRKLLKAVPGTKQAPRSFWETAKGLLEELGWENSHIDPCLFWLRGHLADSNSLIGGLVLHVDDGKLWSHPDFSLSIEESICRIIAVSKWETGKFADQGVFVGEFRGIKETTNFELGYTDYSVENFIEKKLQEVKLEYNQGGTEELGAGEQSEFRSTVGKLQWAKKGRPELRQCVSELAQRQGHATGQDFILANKVIRRFKTTSFVNRLHALCPPLLDGNLCWRGIVITDAGDTPAIPSNDGRWQGGRLTGFTDAEKLAVTEIASKKVKRVSHGSFDAETTWAIESYEECIAQCEVLEEGMFGRRPTLQERVRAKVEGFELTTHCGEMACEIHTDCESLCKAVDNLILATGLGKRRRVDVADLKQEVATGRLLGLTHISGLHNPADCVSKRFNAKGTNVTRERMFSILETGIYHQM